MVVYVWIAYLERILLTCRVGLYLWCSDIRISFGALKDSWSGKDCQKEKNVLFLL